MNNKRIAVSIYIGKNDSDIAIWLNMMRANKLPVGAWLRGLLIVYSLEQTLPVGIIDPGTPLIPPIKNPDLLFGTGFSHMEKTKDGKNNHGWHVRGPNKEIITGSIFSTHIDGEEILSIIEESRNNNQLSTLIKALIRKNLIYGGKNIPPKQTDLKRVMDTYIVRKSKELGKNESVRKEAAADRSENTATPNAAPVQTSAPPEKVVTSPEPPQMTSQIRYLW